MRPTKTRGRRTWGGKQRNLMQYLDEHNPRGGLRSRVLLTRRHDATKCISAFFSFSGKGGMGSLFILFILFYFIFFSSY